MTVYTKICDRIPKYATKVVTGKNQSNISRYRSVDIVSAITLSSGLFLVGIRCSNPGSLMVVLIVRSHCIWVVLIVRFRCIFRIPTGKNTEELVELV